MALSSQVRKSCCGSLCIVAGSDKCCDHEIRKIRKERRYILKGPWMDSNEAEFNSGGFCIVAGSDKCCDHEIRKIRKERRYVLYPWWLYSNEVELTISRYYCESCIHRLDRKQLSAERELCPKERKILTPTPTERKILKKILTTKDKSPQLVQAAFKDHCGHYCRHTINKEECCGCKVAARALQYVAREEPYKNMCDCCIQRDRDEKIRTRSFPFNYDPYPNYFSQRRTVGTKNSNRKKLPSLNCSTVGDIDDICLDDRHSRKVEYATFDQNAARTVASSSLPLSSRNSPLLVWPELVDKHQLEQEQEFEIVVDTSEKKERSGPLESGSEAGEWDLLSTVDSVWTMDSSCTGGTPRRFRDVVLVQGSSNLSPQQQNILPPRINKAPAPDKSRCPTKCDSLEREEEDDGDDDDILTELRNQYKSGRAGKTSKRYHRECKGTEFHYGIECRSWDGYGRLGQVQKCRQSIKRECHRLTRNSSHNVTHL